MDWKRKWMEKNIAVTRKSHLCALAYSDVSC
jgi:hypothetical protein